MALKPSGRKRPGPPTLKALKDRKTMSKIDLNAPNLTRTGEPVKFADGRVQTTAHLILDVVDILLPGDDQGDKKMKLVRLGLRIEDALATGEIDMSKADCTLVLERAKICAAARDYTHLIKTLDPEQLTAGT
jgi:hypothetical protein